MTEKTLIDETCRWWNKTPPTNSTPATATTSETRREVQVAAPPAGTGRPAPRPELVREVMAYRGQASGTPTTPTGTPVEPVPSAAPPGSVAPVKSTPAPDRPYTVTLLTLPDGSAHLGFRTGAGHWVRTSSYPAGATWTGPEVVLTHTPPVLGEKTVPKTPAVAGSGGLTTRATATAENTSPFVRTPDGRCYLGSVYWPWPTAGGRQPVPVPCPPTPN